MGRKSDGWQCRGAKKVVSQAKFYPKILSHFFCAMKFTQLQAIAVLYLLLFSFLFPKISSERTDSSKFV